MNNNINEIEIKISKLDIEKDILFNKYQINDYKSKLSDYDMNSDYHQYLLKNIEIRLLEIEKSKIKLEEIENKIERLNEYDPENLKLNSNEFEIISKKIEYKIDILDKKIDKMTELDKEVKSKSNYFNYITTFLVLILMVLISYTVFFSNKDSDKNPYEHKKACVGESCFRIDQH